MFSGTKIAKLSGEGKKVATQIFHLQQTMAAWLISYKKTCSTYLVNITTINNILLISLIYVTSTSMIKPIKDDLSSSVPSFFNS